MVDIRLTKRLNISLRWFEGSSTTELERCTYRLTIEFEGCRFCVGVRVRVSKVKNELQ